LLSRGTPNKDVVSDPTPHGPRPAVFARLRDEAEVKLDRREPPRIARWLGWALCLAIAAGVVVAAIRSAPL
jgi:uncharacterized protein involved in exopolysaccharide biosynthesis